MLYIDIDIDTSKYIYIDNDIYIYIDRYIR